MCGKLPENILASIFRHNDLKLARSLERRDVVERRFSHIDFSGLECRKTGLRLGHDPDDQAVHIWRAFVFGELPEVLVSEVLLKDDLVALCPGNKFPWARTDRRCGAEALNALIGVADD